MKTFVPAFFLSYRCACVCIPWFVRENGDLGNVRLLSFHISSAEPLECVFWKKRKVAKLVTCETLELRVGSRVGVLCSLSFESKLWTWFGSSKERSLRRIISIVL